MDSCYVGIAAKSNCEARIDNCTFSGNENGVQFWYSTQGASIDSCTFDGNENGVYISAAPHAVVENSTFVNTSVEGVTCVAGSHATIQGNSFSTGATAINCDASNATIVDNRIQNNALGVRCDASDPILKRNRLVDNTNGITTLNAAEPEMDHCGGVCPTVCADANTIRGGTGKRVTNVDPTVTIDAECNYWGFATGKGGGVLASWFYGLVDYNPYLDDDPLPTSPFERDARELPKVYALSPNYPNPFNPSTTIAFQVPAPGGRVSINVFNVRGQLVNTLVNRQVVPGFHDITWDGVDRRGSQVASGVYFVQMLGPAFKQTRKVVLLK